MLYARDMTAREIQGHLEEMYGTEISPTLISLVTDAVIDEVKAWQARPPGGLVGADIEARNAGVQGVPFFIFNRKVAVSGAHEAQTLLQAMEQALEDQGK